MHEHILAAAIGLDKSKPLGRVEPFYRTCRHVRTPCFDRGGTLGPTDGTPQGKPAGGNRRTARRRHPVLAGLGSLTVYRPRFTRPLQPRGTGPACGASP